MSEQSFVKVEASPTFKRNLKILGKKYRSIRKDVEPVIKQLQFSKILLFVLWIMLF